MKHDFDGANIILTGATGELGRRIGHRLQQSGAKLVLLGRDGDRLAALDLEGPRIVGDIADVEACKKAVSTAVSAGGRLDGVVNAGGVVAFGRLDELDDATIDEVLATNLIGPLRLMRAALPKLSEGGFVATLSAVVAEKPMPGMAIYSASKAALTALDRAMTLELRRRKIDVIDVRPPHTETGLAKRPIAGVAPPLPEGLDPDFVADRIVEAIANGEREVASQDF